MKKGGEKQQYWGTLDPFSEEFAAETCDRYREHQELLFRTGLVQRAVRAWAHYHSRDRNSLYDNSELEAFGLKGSQVEAALNEFRSIIRQKIALVMSQKPAYQPLALNDDSEALQATVLARQIIQHYTSKGPVKTIQKEWAETALVMSGAWASVTWDSAAGKATAADPESGIVTEYEGDLDFRVYSPFDVAYDTRCADPRDPTWLITRPYVNRYVLAAQFPKFEDEILAAGCEDRPDETGPRLVADVTGTDRRDDPDYCRPFYVYFKPSIVMPVGRMAIVLDDATVIYSGPSPYSRVPAVPLIPSFQMSPDKTPYGEEHDLLPIVELMQDSYSTLSSGHASQMQVLWAPDGCNVDLEQLGPFAFLQGGQQEPKSLNLFNLPQESYQWPRQLLDIMQRYSMINDALMGDANASDSGSKLAFEASQGMQGQRGFMSELATAMEQLATLMIEVIRSHMSEERAVGIVGKRQGPALVRFSRDQLELVQNVVIVASNPMLDTPQGRQHLVDVASQKGWVDNLDDYILAHTTGQLDMITGDKVDHGILIKRENEQLAMGIPPVLCELDMHRQHISEHSTLLNDEAIRRDPQLKQFVQQHIMEHILALTPGSETFFPQLLMATGQQPLAAQDSTTGAPKPPEMQPPNAEGAPPPPGAGKPQGSPPKEPGMSGQANPDKGPAMPSAPKNPGTGGEAPTPALGTNPTPPGVQGPPNG